MAHPGPQNLLAIDPLRPDGALLLRAAELLKRGDLVVLPTETVYGLAADSRRADAVDRLYSVKGRSAAKEIPLLAAEVSQLAEAGAALDAVARRLAAAFWPGPLTLVVPCGDGFKGFRVPDYEVTRAVIRRTGSVLAVTSANRSGEPPARTAADAARALGESNVALFLDAGPSPGGVPSTVVKVADGKIEILRAGAIGEAQVREAAAAG